MDDLATKVVALTGRQPNSLRQAASSDWATVWRADCAEGALAVKVSHPDARKTARIEARMLDYLAEHTTLPVPKVFGVSDEMLVMTWLEGGGMQGQAAHPNAQRHAQRHMGRLIAELHNITAPEFGFDFDTLYAPIDQPNPKTPDWISFFRDQRLLYMARLAEERGRIDANMRMRVEALGGKLENLIEKPNQPSLVHGDLWQGNIIADGDRIAGFIDPAIYFGHAEMDLAFATLFGTASDDFFAAYREVRPIAPGFFEDRRDLYNLWPLLGHVALFGGGYIGRVDGILRRYGI